jgi:biotin carboxyl carrier protein
MKYIINDMEYNVTVNSVAGDKAEVTVNGVVYQVKIENNEVVNAVPASVQPAAAPVAAAPVSPATPAAPAAGAGKPVKSPLPGVIVAVKVKVGDAVKNGQVVAVLEAMKMENEIQAEFDGVVTSVNVSQGDSILEGAPIVTIG